MGVGINTYVFRWGRLPEGSDTEACLKVSYEWWNQVGEGSGAAREFHQISLETLFWTYTTCLDKHERVCSNVLPSLSLEEESVVQILGMLLEDKLLLGSPSRNCLTWTEQPRPWPHLVSEANFPWYLGTRTWPFWSQYGATMKCQFSSGAPSRGWHGACYTVQVLPLLPFFPLTGIDP